MLISKGSCLTAERRRIIGTRISHKLPHLKHSASLYVGKRRPRIYQSKHVQPKVHHVMFNRLKTSWKMVQETIHAILEADKGPAMIIWSKGVKSSVLTSGDRLLFRRPLDRCVQVLK